MTGKIVASIAAAMCAGFLTTAAPAWYGAPYTASTKTDAPRASVNRLHKGDRLPLQSSSKRPMVPRPDTIRVGCDPAFSTISAPADARSFMRCVV